jgi:hypothetical protein
MSLGRGELVSATCALLLLVCMLAFAWYGVDGIPGSAARSRIVWDENGWQALAVVRWAMLTAIVASLSAVLLHISQRSHGARTRTGPVVASLGAVTALLLIYRVLIDPPASTQVVDQKLGAVLAVVVALGIAAGGWRSLWEERATARVRRRVQPEAGPQGDRGAQANPGPQASR